MYNSFGNSATLILIRDNRDQMVPLDKYFGINGASLSHVYFNICELHHYYHHHVEEPLVMDTIGKELFNYILSTQHTRPDLDSMEVSRIHFHLKNGKIINNEMPLYKGKVE